MSPVTRRATEARQEAGVEILVKEDRRSIEAAFGDESVTVYLGDVREVLATLPAESVQCCVTDLQAAYFAALIDGEGSIECQRSIQTAGRTPRFTIRISFTMATTEPLATVGTWLGLKPLWYPATTTNRQARWRLHIPKRITVGVLTACLPYLILKRRQAEILLALEAVRLAASPPKRHVGFAKMQPMPAAAVAEMEALHKTLRGLKAATC